MALSVPPSRFTSSVGGGSAFYVRRLAAHFMKTIRIITVLTLLLVTSSSCFASIVVETISKERAKELGVTLQVKLEGTNLASVWLEFAPQGETKRISTVILDVKSGTRKIMSADLRTVEQEPGYAALSFTIDPSFLATSTLTVLHNDSGIPPYGFYRFNLGDFVKHEPLH